MDISKSVTINGSSIKNRSFLIRKSCNSSLKETIIQSNYSDYLKQKERKKLVRLSPVKYNKANLQEVPTSIELELTEILTKINYFFDTKPNTNQPTQPNRVIISDNNTMLGLIRDINRHLTNYIQREGRQIIGQKKTQLKNCRVENDKENRLKKEKQINENVQLRREKEQVGLQRVEKRITVENYLSKLVEKIDRAKDEILVQKTHNRSMEIDNNKSGKSLEHLSMRGYGSVESDKIREQKHLIFLNEKHWFTSEEHMKKIESNKTMYDSMINNLMDNFEELDIEVSGEEGLVRRNEKIKMFRFKCKDINRYLERTNISHKGILSTNKSLQVLGR